MRKQIVFFDLCHCSMWTLNWTWKRCGFQANINELFSCIRPRESERESFLWCFSLLSLFSPFFDFFAFAPDFARCECTLTLTAQERTSTSRRWTVRLTGTNRSAGPRSTYRQSNSTAPSPATPRRYVRINISEFKISGIPWLAIRRLSLNCRSAILPTFSKSDEW